MGNHPLFKKGQFFFNWGNSFHANELTLLTEQNVFKNEWKWNFFLERQIWFWMRIKHNKINVKKWPTALLKRLQHRLFAVKFAKFLITSLFTETSVAACNETVYKINRLPWNNALPFGDWLSKLSTNLIDCVH